MSHKFINNTFQSFDLDTFKELLSQSASENELECVENNFIINFFDKNTNEYSHDENNVYNKNENNNNIFIGIDNSNEKNLLERKRNRNHNQSSKHNKFSDDNSIKKIKRILISELHNFINAKIEDIYGDNIGEGMIKKKLMKLCQDQISDASIGFNLSFLNKTLQDIFSENLTGRITNYSPERNKELIEELINDSDEQKRNFFRGLFNVTFLECLKYFRDEIGIHNKYLKGLKKYSDLKEKIAKKDDEVYANHIENYLKDYEIILYKKKPRNSRKRKKVKTQK